MTKRFIKLTITFFLALMATRGNSQQALQIEIDGTKKLQRIDGIGVNANTRSWDPQQLKPAIDLLLDSMHASIWRVIVETVDGWEETNDNNDPFVFNWKYYDSLYETPKFRKAWDMIAYLNKRSITDNLVINFMGFAPSWMGNKVIEPGYEDEYVEMIGSFFYYAIKNKQLKFGLIAPTNESDHHKFSEGPHLTGEQHTRILRKLIERMDKWGITGNIKIVAPDNADKQKSFNEFLPAMMKDSLVMSRTAHLGFHSYSGNGEDIQPYIRSSSYPSKTYWITEWNNWCNGCDDGILGDYSYNFARKSVQYLLNLLGTGANACLLWEGYDSYYTHHAPSKFSYWGVLGYDSVNGKYPPRKHFYAIQQVSRFVMPGSTQLALQKNIDSVEIVAFIDSDEKQVAIVGVNENGKQINLQATLRNLAAAEATLYYTDEKENLASKAISLKTNVVDIAIPANCIYTLVIKQKSFAKINPEPKGWYSGDIHVHRNCGDDVVHAVEDVTKMMETNDLAVMSLLADMGNGEVKYSEEDLPKVNGKDMSQTPGKIWRWDTEWHWDATYSQFSNQALGGHLVLLGLDSARQIWEESPYKILEWAKKQNAVRGFAHFQYLNDNIQKELNCCIPVDYPVEAALGTIDFVSEDVFSTNFDNSTVFSSEAAMNAYYKLLNCGFKIGLAAGTDYPCNNNEPPGTMLTYAKVDGKLTYRKWIDAIKKGQTVVSRNGHREFIDLKVNNNFSPGDEIKSGSPVDATIEVKWSCSAPYDGWIELVHNGDVISSQPATAEPGTPFTFKTKVRISESGWICARRMARNGHQVHTAPVYFSIDNKPVRANSKDAQFFVSWIDNILEKITPGGDWNRYFTKDRDEVIERYKKARAIYLKIAEESDRAPILVLNSQKGFGNYVAEILRTEGLNAFETKTINIETISPESLGKRKVVIIASDNISDQQAAAFTEYVKNGGNLISTMPPKKMQQVFGITTAQRNTDAGHLRIIGKSPLAKGITLKRMRLHGRSARHALNGAQIVAEFDDKYPAIVLNTYGKGRSMAFLYNLPQSIVLTRQGNPADAGLEMDSIPGLRAMDLFTGRWVDTSCNTLNHADEQMRLLSNGIQYMSTAHPLPKLWYFPDTLSCAVTLNNDGEDSKEAEFEPQFNDVFAKGAKMTLYVKEVELVSKKWTDKWRARGFEISGHPDQTKHATDPGWNRMDSIYKALNAKLKSLLDVPPMKTVTNHWFVWPGIYDDGQKDFAAQAKLEELNGIGLDCNYAHYDNNAREKSFLGSTGYGQGNYTGSGLPMKFADANGNILNIFQQLNNVYDQQYMEHDDKDGYFNAFKGIMDRSIDNGVYSYISVRAHNNEYFFSKVPLMKMLDYANSKNIPVWTEQHLLDFLRSRDEAGFKNISWQNNRLTFTLHSSVAGESTITCLLPYSFNEKEMESVMINGEKRHFYKKEIKGATYAMLPVKPGLSYQFVVAYKK
ncbi:MAG: CehA/McbA family metallohydrolase [Chitinophagaceae bacterium]|nr:CehA/McbA family metallohydrolase [Chitinophagaceae bacterium]